MNPSEGDVKQMLTKYRTELADVKVNSKAWVKKALKIIFLKVTKKNFH